MSISVLIVDDQEIVRVGLKVVLEKNPSTPGQPEIEVIGVAQDGLDALEKLETLKPDVVVMDIGLPFMDGVEATSKVKSKYENIKVVMLTSHRDDRHIFAALAAGADAYCLKETSGDQLAFAVRSVYDGAAWLDPLIARRLLSASLSNLKALDAAKVRSQDDKDKNENKKDIESLSSRELDVLRLVTDGLTNQEIAEKLVLSVETVKTHMRHIMEKLRVSDRTQAAVKAMREGLFDI